MPFLKPVKNKRAISFIDVLVAIAIAGSVATMIYPATRAFFDVHETKTTKSIAIDIAQNQANYVQGIRFADLTNHSDTINIVDDKWYVETIINPENYPAERLNKNVIIHVFLKSDYDAGKKSPLYTTTVNRTYVHYYEKDAFKPTGHIVTIPVPALTIKMHFKIWGAGGGNGGNDDLGHNGYGLSGGAGGSVIGVIPVTPGQSVELLAGSAGQVGGSGGGVPGASAGEYGGGGPGGGTGWSGWSGAGGSGGGMSYIKVNGSFIAIAGGGGGGGGGSNWVPAATGGSVCSSQNGSSFAGNAGVTCPSDGAGGGGGGGGYYGGLGGRNGYDNSQSSMGGCYGGSYGIDGTQVFPPWYTTPGNASDEDRGDSGNPNTDGSVLLFWEKESSSTI